MYTYSLYVRVIFLAEIARKYFFSTKSVSPSLLLDYISYEADHKIVSMKQSMCDTVNIS